MKPIVLADDFAVGRYAAEIIFSEVVRAATENRSFVLGCPGGRTPRSTYKGLADLIKESKTNISHVIIAMMDEFLEENADGTYSNHTLDKHFSCTRFAKLEIFDVLNAGAPVDGKIALENVRFPDASDPQSYEDFLRKVGVDVFLMASGASDGHVAFNPPGSKRDECTRIVRIADETRHDKSAVRPVGKCLDPASAFSCPQHQDPAPERGGSDDAAHQRPIGDQQSDPEKHGVNQSGSPERVARQEKLDHRQCDDSEAYGNQQAGNGKAHRPQRICPVCADRDHRQPNDAGENR